MATSTIKQPATRIERCSITNNSSFSFSGYNNGCYQRIVCFTFTVTPGTNSLIKLNVSELGLSQTPRMVIPISCFPDAICYYDYDSSSAQEIAIGVRNYSGGYYTSILRILCLIGIE